MIGKEKKATGTNVSRRRFLKTVGTGAAVAPPADLPCRYAILREHQQHAFPDIGPGGGGGPHRRR